MIKHVSFDLWLTLIKSNKNFKTAQISFIKDYLNNEFSEDQISQAFSRLSGLGDCYGEYFEKGFTAHQLYFLFFHQILGKNVNRFFTHKEKLNTFVYDMQTVFIENCPHLISDEVFDILEHLKSKNITCNIASNTSYANGKMLRECMKKLKIYDYFQFMLFSDEIGVFKPNLEFFKLILENSKSSHSEILHVGDNTYTDIMGADRFGFTTLLFKPEMPNYSTIKNFT